MELFYSEYYRKIYGHISPDDLFDIQKKHGIEIIDFIGLATVKTINSVLEIGCGSGGILSAFNDLNKNVTGVDFDYEYLTYGINKGINLLKIENSHQIPKQKYDLIILSHVLEHISYPKDYLLSIRENFLSENGYLYIEVPSLELVQSGDYDYDLLKYFQNAHVIHFNLKSFKNLISLCGFKQVKLDPFIKSLLTKGEIINTYQDHSGYTLTILNDINFNHYLHSPWFYLKSRVGKFMDLFGLRNFFKKLLFI